MLMPALEAAKDLAIRKVEAFAVFFAMPQDKLVQHGIGAAVARDTVLLKVSTECGVTGWAEAHSSDMPPAFGPAS
jgi:hypothetical protein